MTTLGLVFNGIILGMLLIVFFWAAIITALKLVLRSWPSALLLAPLIATLIAIRLISSLF